MFVLKLSGIQKILNIICLDPEFDDDIPDILKNKEKDFFKIFGPVIKKNARWSNKTPVPLVSIDRIDWIDKIDIC